MDRAALSNTFEHLRVAVSRAETDVANARPEALDSCHAVLQQAAADMQRCRALVGAHRGDAGLLAQAREIRRRVGRLRGLLHHAAQLHTGRAGIVGELLAGYTAAGRSPEWRYPSRISIRG